MPLSLSRIEREYVIRNLEEICPPLSVLTDNRLCIVPSKAYTVTSEQVELQGFLSEIPSETAIQIHFRHKQRALYFSSHFHVLGINRFAFSLPQKIFKDDSNTEINQTEKIQIFRHDSSFESFGLSRYPLDTVLVDPELCLSRGEAIRKVALRAGMEETGSLSAYRLFEYLDSFRQTKQTASGAPLSGHLIFIDHKIALVSVTKFDTEGLQRGNVLDVTVSFENRIISIDSLLAGFFSVHANLTLLCLDIGNAQKEDKRFLFERIYRHKYQE